MSDLRRGRSGAARLSAIGSNPSSPERLAAEVREALLGQRARAGRGEELLRGAETRAVVDALAAGGHPADADQRHAARVHRLRRARIDGRATTPICSIVGRATLTPPALCWRHSATPTTVHCSDLFSQFEVQKIDRFGVAHAFDVHWRISTQPVFADVLDLRRAARSRGAGACARLGRPLAPRGGRRAAAGVRASGDASPQRQSGCCGSTTSHLLASRLAPKRFLRVRALARERNSRRRFARTSCA